MNVKKLEPEFLVSEDKEKHVHCHDGACNCHVDHSHEIEEKSGILGFIKENILLILGIVLYVAAMIFKDSMSQVAILFILSYVLVGGKVVLTALKNIRRGQILMKTFL